MKGSCWKDGSPIHVFQKDKYITMPWGHRRFSLPLLTILLLINFACNLPSLTVTPSDSPRATDLTSPPSESTRTSIPLSPTRTAHSNPTSVVERTPALLPTSIPPTLVVSLDDLLATCPTEEEIERFQIDFDIFIDPEVGLPPYSCEDTNPRLAIYQALRAMSALYFDQPLPWTSYSLYDWLRGAVSGIVLRATEISYCCDDQNRIVLKSELLSQPSYSSWYDPQSGIGLMDLVGLIVHEARHAEIGGHTCGNSDDATLDEMGAWGVQHYYFLWMAEHTPPGLLTPTQREAAITHAETALGRICNP